MRKGRKYFLRRLWAKGILLWGALGGIFALAAQEEESVRIYHAEGGDFTLTLGDARTLVPAGEIPGEGIALERMGIIHTGPETRLEMQFIPSGAVLKLAENTSVIYNGADKTGGFSDLGLLYGRLRVSAGDETKTSGGHTIVVRGGGVSVRIRGGDFGVDYILDPDSWNSARRPLFRICAFRGGAEVFPFGREGNSAYFGAAGAVSVGPWESLSLDISAEPGVSAASAFAEKKVLEEETAGYWRLHNFAGTPPLPMPVTEIVSPLAAVPETVVPAVPETVIRYVPVEAPPPAPLPEFSTAKKNVYLALGLVLTVTAAVAQGVSFSQFNTSWDETARRVFLGAYPVMGLGVLSTLMGLLYNPGPE